jgi:hypothetical protein
MFSFRNQKKSKGHTESNLPGEESVTDSSESEQAKLHSIKAFRTITTMLNLIPSEHVVTVVDRKTAGGDDDKELKLLNALATLLVRRNEVAAVAVTEHDVSGAIQVIACFHISPSDELTIPQPDSSSRILKFKNFLATINPRKDTPLYMSDRPSIRNPDVPLPVQEAEDIKLIQTYCYNNWWV